MSGYIRLLFTTAFLTLFIYGCKESGSSVLVPDGKATQFDNSPGTISELPPIPPGSVDGEDGNVDHPDDEGGGNDTGFITNLVTDNFVQANFTFQYDFLWVVDNSGSMADNRAVMIQNFNHFLTILQSRRSLNWQMAVTNTDAVITAGNLIAGTGGVRVINSQMANVNAAWSSILGNIVNTARSYWEQGLESGYRAIDAYGSEFSRTNVPLVVGYVSDEQDYSCASNCHGYSASPEGFADVVYHPISRYHDQYRHVASSRGTDVIPHSIVHLSPLRVPEACDTSGSLGGRYMAFQTAWSSGGQHSLCPTEMAASFEAVAQLIANRGVCFTLRHPLASMNSFRVLVDGGAVPSSSSNGYVFESSSNAVCFTGTYIPQNGSTIDVTYRRVMN